MALICADFFAGCAFLDLSCLIRDHPCQSVVSYSSKKIRKNQCHQWNQR